jgi:hypothetical protein
MSFIYFNKLEKSVAAKAVWALELGVVATSNNSQQQHGQLQCTQLKPSPIAIDVINAIIVRRQSTHETSLSNTTRKAVVISLKATRRPHQQMQQERWWASWVSQQYSSRNNNHCHRSVICWDTSTMGARRRQSMQETSGRLGKFMTQISCDKHGINNKTYLERICKQNKKTKPSWHVRHASCTTIAGQAADRVTWQSQWHRP